jgi:phosphoribosylanthranilate isomerase
MTWVKVCGLSTPADVVAANEAGADAVGFVLADSPRQLTLTQAKELVPLSGALTVLVTVDLPAGEVLDIFRATGADALQPHGAFQFESGLAALELGKQVILPVPAGSDITPVDQEFTLLMDTPSKVHHGGTGKTFDWDLAKALGRPVVLAGGLGPHNVADAIAAVRPWGVDASSGLELSPGVKDHERIRLYVERAKTA